MPIDELTDSVKPTRVDEPAQERLKSGEVIRAESASDPDVSGLETIKAFYLRYSFTLAFVLIGVAILCIGGFVVQDLRHTSEDTQRMYASSIRGLDLIGELQYQTQEARRSMLYALTT